jgi:hypothetical protein
MFTYDLAVWANCHARPITGLASLSMMSPCATIARSKSHDKILWRNAAHSLRLLRSSSLKERGIAGPWNAPSSRSRNRAYRESWRAMLSQRCASLMQQPSERSVDPETRKRLFHA